MHDTGPGASCGASLQACPRPCWSCSKCASCGCPILTLNLHKAYNPAGLTTTALELLDTRVVLLPVAEQAPAAAPPAAPPAAAATAEAQAAPVPASIGGVPTWVVGGLGAVAGLLVLSLACLCGAPLPATRRRLWGFINWLPCLQPRSARHRTSQLSPHQQLDGRGHCIACGVYRAAWSGRKVRLSGPVRACLQKVIVSGPARTSTTEGARAQAKQAQRCLS